MAGKFCFGNTCPTTRPFDRLSLPTSVRVTFSGLSDVFRAGLGKRYTLTPASTDSSFPVLLQVAALGPGVPLGENLDDYKGPVTGISVLPNPPSIFSFSPGGQGYAVLGRVAPTIVAVLNYTGTGAEFSAELEEITSPSGVPYWRIAGVTITGSGYGYEQNSRIIFLLSDGDSCATPPDFRLQTVLGEPTLHIQLSSSPCNCSTPGEVPGQGAEFQINYTKVNAVPFVNEEYWEVSSVTVVNGGSGYPSSTNIAFLPSDGDVVSLSALGSLVISDGVITSVTITRAGRAWKPGVPTVATMFNQGAFFRNDKDASPYLLPITVTSGGAPGADLPTFNVTVDEDISSPTFGYITDVELDDPGDNQIAWYEAKSCTSLLNDQTVTFPLGNADFPAQSVSVCPEASFGFRPIVTLTTPDDYDGLESPLPGVELVFAGSSMAIRKRIEPAFTPTAAGGTGAIFHVRYRERITDRKLNFFTVSSIAVVEGGSGYTDNSVMGMSPATADDKSVSPFFSLRLRTKRLPPEVTADTFCHSGGATFELNWTQNSGVSSFFGAGKTFGLSFVKVLNGGSGYSGLVPIRFVALASGSFVESSNFACAIGTTNASGQIVSVEVVTRGRYWKNTSEAEYVQVLAGGTFYRETNEIRVADVTTEIRQQFPSNGSGASVSFQVDDDPSSPTFGEAINLSLDDAGSGYILSAQSPGTQFTLCPTTTEIQNPQGIQCVLTFQRGDSYPTVELQLPDVNFPAIKHSLLFAADRDSVESLTPDNKSVVLNPLIPGNTGQALVEWGGQFDPDDLSATRVCSCCELDDTICFEPADSGWPPPNENPPVTYPASDPLGLVFFRSCAGTNQNDDSVTAANNGGLIQYTANYDGNGDFVSWNRLCGECTEAILIGVDENNDPVYSTTPLPSSPPSGLRGRTLCRCYASVFGCLWEPEIGNDGCWTGQYLFVETTCENPLP